MDFTISAYESFFPPLTSGERNAFPELCPNWPLWIEIIESYGLQRIGDDGKLYLVFPLYQ